MNSEKLKNTRAGAVVWLVMLLLLVSVTNLKAQEYTDVMLKKVGNLYILNVGSNDDLESFRIYNLFFEEESKLPIPGLRFTIKKERKFFGAVQVTQIFPEYAVVRVVARQMEGEPVGKNFILAKRELPDELKRRAYEESGLELPKSLREEEPEQGSQTVISVDIPVKPANYMPFSIGLNYFYETGNVSKPVTEDLQKDLEATAYENSGIYDKTYKACGGIGAQLEKMLRPNFMVRGALSIITQESEMKSEVSPDLVRDPGVTAVEKWDFNIRTRVTDWSLSLHYSNFTKAVSYFALEERASPWGFRFGTGVNYAKVSVEMDEFITLRRFTGPVDQTTTENFSMGGYWGMHATAAIDYYLNAARLFCEVTYKNWMSVKFDSTIPVRFGAVVFF